MPVSSEQQARQRIKKLVQNTKVRAGYSGESGYEGPGDPLAKHLGIMVKEVLLTPGEEGQYIPTDPPIIILDPTTGKERCNFTYYHEISHHLISQDAELYSFIHEYASYQDEVFQSALEQFCNLGAAEFLIPAAEVSRVVRQQGFSIELVRSLELQYPASKPAIAMQLAHTANHRCFVVVCEWGCIYIDPSAQISYLPTHASRSGLYVLYGASSPTAKYPIGRFARVPQEHPIYESYRLRRTVKREAPILFKNGNRDWICECEAFYHKGKVYAAFNASDPVPAEQLSLF